jgi:four helix bundle protein
VKKSYRDLFVWESAVELAADIIQIASAAPLRQCRALADQMPRCAVSISSNIAEGQGRASPRDWRRFLSTARGSAYELETQIEIAKRAHLISVSDAKTLNSRVAQIARGISRLMDYVSDL